MRRWASALAFFLWVAAAHADCVTGAKMATGYRLAGPNTILLFGSGQVIVIHTFQFMYSPGQVVVLKDSFCSFSDAVLLVGDQVINAQEVDVSQ